MVWRAMMLKPATMFILVVLSLSWAAVQSQTESWSTAILEGQTGLDPPIVITRRPEGAGPLTITETDAPPGLFVLDGGELLVTRLVDWSTTQDGYFQVKIGAGETTTAEVTVNVVPVNEHSPTFPYAAYEATVPQTSPTGTSVLRVAATDLDSGVDGRLTYDLFMPSGSRWFSISQQTGEIKVLNPNSGSIPVGTYPMKVRAVDGGVPAMAAMADITVTVKDENEEAPTFIQYRFEAVLKEDTPSGQSILRVLAYDGDSTASLVYSIVPGTTDVTPTGNQVNAELLFQLDRSTGELTSRRQLVDSGIQDVNFKVQVKDVAATHNTPQKAEAIVRVVVQAPTEAVITGFADTYTAEFAENTLPGTVLLRVEAMSNVNAPVMIYEVTASDMNNYFDVVTSDDSAVVRLGRSVNYNDVTHALQLQLRAEAGGVMRHATVTFDVTNANNHVPAFEAESLTQTVPAYSMTPLFIGVVSASDLDTGPFGQVKYTLDKGNSNMFRIDEDLGYLSVAEGVTLTPSTVYEMQVKAEDNMGGHGAQSFTTKLTVETGAAATGSGSVSAQEVSAVVSEDTAPQQVVVTIRLDEGIRTFQASGGEAKQYFSVLGENSVGVVRASQALSGLARPAPYQMTVVATGSNVRQQAIVTVSVWVRAAAAASDGPPQFVKPDRDQPVVRMQEERPLGSWVTTVTAYSPATGASADILYKIADTTDKQYFQMDPGSGMITTRARLDREARTQYSLVIEATSKGRSSLPRTITVQLIDIDDNTPAFMDCESSGPALTARVLENQAPGTHVVTVRACDEDEAPYNHMRYEIVCGNTPYLSVNFPFKVEPATGAVTTEVPLDYERTPGHQFVLCVAALAAGDPSPEPGAVTAASAADLPYVAVLTVLVGDVDDNRPTMGWFHNVSDTVGILAETPFHTPIKQMVWGGPTVDPADVTYSVASISFKPDGDAKQSAPEAFSIDPDTGIVYTNQIHYLETPPGAFFLKLQARSRRTSEEVGLPVSLSVYTVRANQLQRLVLDQVPRAVDGALLASTIGNAVKAYMSVGELRFHIKAFDDLASSSVPDYDMTDVCFHLVTNTAEDQTLILTPKQVADRFRNRNNAVQLTQAAKKFGIKRDSDDNIVVDHCTQHMTTWYWAGYWYLWWLLIALALFLILLALICMCCLAHSHARTKRCLPASRPYTMLDPYVVPYEYEEATVHM